MRRLVDLSLLVDDESADEDELIALLAAALLSEAD
jgi:hypothetical protein